MSDDPPKPPPPGYVRFKTFEEMSPYERELYTPRRWQRDDDGDLPGLNYDPIAKADSEVPSCHRDKDDD